MKHLLPLILILLTLSQPSESLKRCDLPLLNLVGCQCELYPDYIDRLIHILKDHLFGQDEAIDKIVSAIRLHRFSSDTGPSTIHIAGDNGVGKSYTSKLIGEGMFKRKSDRGSFFPKGVLYLRGSTFHTSNHEELTRTLGNHIKECNYPLIIVDEVEEMPPDMIVVIRTLLDDSVGSHELGGMKVDAYKAIFIFLSDFGTEGFSEKKTRDELIELVHKESLKFWKDPKQTALIKHVIPFYPMAPESAYLFIQNRIGLLSTYPTFKEKNIKIYYKYSEKEVRDITSYFLKRSKDLFYEYKNYRGLEQLFEEEIISEILAQANPNHSYSLSISITSDTLSILLKNLNQKPDL